ncbi:chorismate synthase [Bacillota bacterium LX-D]|nr:chorismate synthase [Bacillota bacterium LX-D]
MLRFLTAGESHGKCLTAIIEGFPAGLNLTADYINKELARRQHGYGRGARMEIEHDQVSILSGIRGGKTLGSPITLNISNKDWENWQNIMSPEEEADLNLGTITKPRPGHADLSGAIKYEHKDLRNVLERSSARETATRVAVGAVAKKLLQEINIEIISHVISIGDVKSLGPISIQDIKQKASNSPVFCADIETEKAMLQAIDRAKDNKDTLGGIFEVIVLNMPMGIGSFVHWDRKLDAMLAQGLMSIQAIKGVEFGIGFRSAALPGSRVQDEIAYNQEQGFFHLTNNAGGLEGGMTNGEPLIIRAAMKPIPTLMQPLASVDLHTKEPFNAAVERSDVCAVPAASVIGEAVVAFTLAQAILEKFGGDTLEEIKDRVNKYREYLRQV